MDPLPGDVADYVTDAVEHLKDLDAAIKDLRFKLRNYNPTKFAIASYCARGHARKLINALQMVEHCIREAEKP